MDYCQIEEFGYQPEEMATSRSNVIHGPGRSYRRFAGLEIELPNFRDEYSGLAPNVDMNSTGFSDRARILRVDAKLEDGAKRIALLLGVDLSR